MIIGNLARAAALCLSLNAVGAEAAKYSATSATLATVFAKAVGGDTIILSGNFGSTKLASTHAGTGSIYIDARKAVFTDTLRITGVNGLTISGGKFGSAIAKTDSGRAILVSGGSNIMVKNAVFIGNKDNKGIEFIDTATPSVWSSSFTNLWVGTAFTRVTNGTIAKNSVVGSVSDGYVVADSHTVLVNKNSCSAGTPWDGAHPDCVQMWSVAGHAVQSDITVSGNYASGNTQGFTSFDPAWGGELRAAFIDNRVDTSQAQGIACYGCVDSQVTGNVVTTLPGSRFMTNINVIGGSDNIVADNSIGPKPTAPTAALQMSSSASLAPSIDDIGVSAAVAVPEPGTWALLIAGFGLVGTMQRRRSNRGVPA